MLLVQWKGGADEPTVMLNGQLFLIADRARSYNSRRVVAVFGSSAATAVASIQ
jgi:hypothetical protein